MAAGEAWADELHRSAQLRVSRGEPSILSSLTARLPSLEDARQWSASARAHVGSVLESSIETLEAVTADPPIVPSTVLPLGSGTVQLASLRPV